MKLIKAHIDNFGCLHQQEFLFEEEGLSVYQSPNGSGKSTLSIFIKAMFYGLVGAARSVDGNERKRYAPWQGGKFGGYLIFSHADKTYRITRHFGKTKRDDSVELTNEITGRVCGEIDTTSSQEAIGIAIFGLDAESFAKTVFLPQGKAVEEFSTSSISDKLIGMLEASGENGGGSGYDEAVARVKAARKEYKPFRGTGGKAAKIELEITRLENEIARKEQSESLLEDVERRLLEKEVYLDELDRQITLTREAISKASMLESNRMLLARAQELEVRVESIRRDLEKEKAVFPARMPELEELEEILEKANDFRILNERNIRTLSVDSSQDTINALRNKFSDGIPDEQELESAFEACGRLSEGENLLAQSSLSIEESSELKQLQMLFDGNFLLEGSLDKIEELIAERNKLQGIIEAYQASDEDRSKLSSLRSFFKRGIPGEEVIGQMEAKLDDADALRRRSSEKLEEAFSPSESADALGGKTGNAAKFVLIAIAVIMLVGAVVSLSLSLAASIGCVAIAIVCGFGVMLVGRRKVEGSGSVVSDPRAKSQADKLKYRPDALTDEVREFVEKYISDGRPLRAALVDIRVKAATLDALSLEMNKRESQVQGACDKMSQCDCAIADALGSFYRKDASYDSCIADMRKSIERFETLKSRALAYTSMMEKVGPGLREDAAAVIALLSRYGIQANEDDDLRASLIELKAEASRYDEALKMAEDIKSVRQESEIDAAHLREEIAAELRSLGFSGNFGVEQILGLRDARKSVGRLEGSLAVARKEQEAFLRDNPLVCEFSDKDLERQSGLNLEDVSGRESQLLAKRNSVRDELDALRSCARDLSQEVADLAALHDELDDARCTRRKIESDLGVLDATIEFLGIAKEALSRKYQGPVVSAFSAYADLVFSDSDFRVDESLSVSLEYKGSFKDAAYLSAGVADMVAICMRMALADTLFGKEEAFVLLDDPFTNLDNSHMGKALELLKQIAGNRQIVYLTCHSSRVPEW